jgi:hypothetical protein
MSSPLTFNPPITIDLCETAGQEFGGARIGMERAIFEQELVAQLAALVEALRAADIDRDRALAAFDTAAWDAWEAPPAPEVTFQEQPSLCLQAAKPAGHQTTPENRPLASASCRGSMPRRRR